jgi:predicted TPR repeat methyltransferase
MESELILKLSDELSANYDSYMQNHGWKGPDILFEMIKDNITAGESLLDLGIGTGLSSQPFYDAGLRIFGIDGALGMIKICKSKKIAHELVLYDITSEVDFPFSGRIFEVAIAYAVFHFIDDLSTIFHTISDRLTSKGIFCFSILLDNTNPKTFKETSGEGVFVFENQKEGFKLYSHGDKYIKRLLESNHFNIKKRKSILAFINEEERREVYFELYVSQKSR